MSSDKAFKAKTKYLVWIPFHRCEPDSARFKATLARADWWKGRELLLGRYTLASLLNQTDRDFAIAGLFHREAHARAAVCKSLIEAAGGKVWTAPRGLPETALEPRELMSAEFDADKDLTYLVMVRLDSDDAYVSKFMAALKNYPVDEGVRVWARHGFAVNCDTGEAAHYRVQGPMPFYATAFTRASVATQVALDAYLRKWKLDRHHYRVQEGVRAKCMLDGWWGHTFNEFSTATGGKNLYAECKHVVWPLDLEKRKAPLRALGVLAAKPFCGLGKHPLMEELLKGSFGFGYRAFYDAVAARRYARLVEVGVWKGASLAHLAAAAKASNPAADVHGVDAFSGVMDLDIELNATLAEKAMSEDLCDYALRRAGVRSGVRLHRGISWERAADFENGSVGFVYLDAGHSYESVRRDLDAWTPKVATGGLLAGHDFSETHRGVAQAVMERFGSLAKVGVVQGCPSVWQVEAPNG